MRFGYFVDAQFLLEDDPRGREIFEGVLAAGYDYIETQLTKLLGLSPAAYEAFKGRLAQAGVPCRAGMMIFPYSMPLVGDGRDMRVIEEHAKRTLALAADLGCEVVVFGHGGARAVPAGMGYEEARGRLIDVLRVLAGLARENHLRIAIEPLCDTNMIVSFPEAAALAQECGGNVGAVFDLYHAAALGQTPEDILAAPERLFHLHIACPGTRETPRESDDYGAFIQAVKRCGYEGMISVEAGVPVGAGIAGAVDEALRVVRGAFDPPQSPEATAPPRGSRGIVTSPVS